MDVTLVINLAQLRLAQQNATTFLTYWNSMSRHNTGTFIIFTLLIVRLLFPFPDDCSYHSFWTLHVHNHRWRPATALQVAWLHAALSRARTAASPSPGGGRLLVCLLRRRRQGKGTRPSWPC